MSIEVSHLTKVYGSQKAVNDISFSVGKAEIVGFLGPNGAGKSTSMKMITGYLPATSGHAAVGGIDVQENPTAVKQKIGYLAELNALYYDMYIREYLGFIAEVHALRNKKEAVERSIEMVGLQPEAHKKIGQLSKGYKQRVGLAAALIHDPEVLILDEPTTGLDPNQILEIREVIRKQGESKTVLFSSHILQEVEALCDRVIIINKGNIVADARLADLQKTGSEKHMVRVRLDRDIDIEALKNLAAAGAIQHSGTGQYSIETDEPDQLRKQILSLAVDNNLNIISLQSESQSLEETFRLLTKAPEQGK